MSTNHNDLSCPSARDAMRFMTMRVWSSTMERTAEVDLDICGLACEEACRRYQEMTDRSTLPLICREDVQKAMEAWATWHALACQVARRQQYAVSAHGLCTFTHELEDVLERLIGSANPILDNMFIL
jgi:hypothetical protein